MQTFGIPICQYEALVNGVDQNGGLEIGGDVPTVSLESGEAVVAASYEAGGDAVAAASYQAGGDAVASASYEAGGDAVAAEAVTGHNPEATNDVTAGSFKAAEGPVKAVVREEHTAAGSLKSEAVVEAAKSLEVGSVAITPQVIINELYELAQ